MATIKVRDDSPHLVFHLKLKIWQTGMKMRTSITTTDHGSSFLGRIKWLTLVPGILVWTISNEGELMTFTLITSEARQRCAQLHTCMPVCVCVCTAVTLMTSGHRSADHHWSINSHPSCYLPNHLSTPPSPSSSPPPPHKARSRLQSMSNYGLFIE